MQFFNQCPADNRNDQPENNISRCNFRSKILISNTRLPRSTIGEEIKNEKVTPNGNPALVNPINNGMEEQEQKE